MYAMSVTAAVFHPEMSSLKAFVSLNMFDMSVTAVVFQPEMF